MLAVGDVDAAPARCVARQLLAGLLGAILEEVEPLGLVQVEAHGAIGTVELEGLLCLVAAGVARALEHPHGTVGEAADKDAGIVDAHGLNLAGLLMQPLLHKGLGLRQHPCDRPV